MKIIAQFDDSDFEIVTKGMQQDFLNAVDFAINQGIDACLFLDMWREGNWNGIKEYFPTFVISDFLLNPSKHLEAAKITYFKEMENNNG